MCAVPHRRGNDSMIASRARSRCLPSRHWRRALQSRIIYLMLRIGLARDVVTVLSCTHAAAAAAAAGAAFKVLMPCTEAETRHSRSPITRSVVHRAISACSSMTHGEGEGRATLSSISPKSLVRSAVVVQCARSLPPAGYCVCCLCDHCDQRLSHLRSMRICDRT